MKAISFYLDSQYSSYEKQHLALSEIKHFFDGSSALRVFLLAGSLLGAVFVLTSI